MEGMKKVAKAEVKAHEKRMHNMRQGGVTSSDMKKMGRGLAKVANQKVSSFTYKKSAGRGR